MITCKIKKTRQGKPRSRRTRNAKNNKITWTQKRKTTARNLGKEQPMKNIIQQEEELTRKPNKQKRKRGKRKIYQSQMKI